MPIENLALNPKPTVMIAFRFSLIILPTINDARNFPKKLAKRSHTVSWRLSAKADKLTLKPIPKKKIGPKNPYAIEDKADKAFDSELNDLRKPWNVSPAVIAPSRIPNLKYWEADVKSRAIEIMRRKRC